jgi:hypothetical protein
MFKTFSPKLKAKFRIVSSTIQCVIWTALSFHSWQEDPRGLYFWLFVVLVGYSVIILRIDVISYLRIQAAGGPGLTNPK